MVRFLLIGLLLASAARAQIAPTKPSRQQAAARQALREADRTDAPYKDSHLDVSRRQMRRGVSTQPTRMADEPRFGRDGRPRVTQPRFPGLRRRSKNEPKP
jgi:hypothetical protein